MKKSKITAVTIASAAMFFTSAYGDELQGKRSPAEILESSASEDWAALDPDNTLYIELKRGRVVIALSSHLAQAHVEQVKTLARENFYNGLSFYRVIDGFVAQGGDPFSERSVKNAKEAMSAEFEEPLRDTIPFSSVRDEDGYANKVGFINSIPAGSDGNSIWHLHCPGAFAFGRNNERDSASTEFYITLQSQRYLDRNLSVFGKVVSGMEHLQGLRRVSPPASKDDDLGETILSIDVAADVEPAERTNLEVLRSGTATFNAYLESRRNRPEDFFYFRPDYLDVCQFTLPTRQPSDG